MRHPPALPEQESGVRVRTAQVPPGVTLPRHSGAPLPQPVTSGSYDATPRALLIGCRAGPASHGGAVGDVGPTSASP